MTEGLSPGAILGVAAAGGALLALDAAPLAQTLVSQPLPAAVLTGLVLRCGAAAAPIGIALQALWTSLLPLGGSLIPDSGPATVGAVAAAALLLADPTTAPWAVPVGMAVAFAGGVAGAHTVMWGRRANHGLVRAAEAQVVQGDVAAVERAHVAALGLAAARGAAVALVLAVAGWGLGLALSRATGETAASLAAAATAWILPAGVGVMVAAAVLRARRAAWWAVAGVVIGAGVAWRG